MLWTTTMSYLQEFVSPLFVSSLLLALAALFGNRCKPVLVPIRLHRKEHPRTGAGRRMP